MKMNIVGKIQCIDNNGCEDFTEGEVYTVYSDFPTYCYIKVRGRRVTMDEVDQKIQWKKISGEVW